MPGGALWRVRSFPLPPAMLHPASLLVAWIAAAVALQQAGPGSLAAAAAVVIPATVVLAPRRAWRLIRRSRWLLLSLAVLFVFATPGEYVSPLPGVTREGLELAAEHLSRLVLLLLLLALLLERIDNTRLMSGMYLLLKPASAIGFDRGQVVVRLMLVLEYVDGSSGENHWRDWLKPPLETASVAVRLPVMPLGTADYLLLAAAALATCLMLYA